MLLRRLTLVPVAALLLASAAQAAPSSSHSNSSSKSKQGGIAYKWTDEQGVVHYGDYVDPQYSQKDRAVLNNQGVEVSHIDAAKSAEALAAEARARAVALKQRQHDSFLISTYTSVKDIEALRDVRLDQLKGQRAAAEQYVDSLRMRLGALQTRAVTFTPYNDHADARRMPDDLAENLVQTVNEVRLQTAALTAKGEEEKTLRAQFDADIQRYTELHTIHE
jgi:hypothetical protein